MTTITVNGRATETHQASLSYEEVVVLAGRDPQKLTTVTYRGASRSGDLVPGTMVTVEAGMVFNVTVTDRA